MRHVPILSHVETEALSGLDLKVARVRRRVRQKAIAEGMGVSQSRITAIEREQFPSAETVRRYLEALDTCPTSGTVGAA